MISADLCPPCARLIWSVDGEPPSTMFQRGERLVTVLSAVAGDPLPGVRGAVVTDAPAPEHNRKGGELRIPVGTPVVRVLAPASLRERLSMVAEFVGNDGRAKGLVTKRVPCRGRS